MEMIMELIENGEEKGGWVKRWGFWGGGGVRGEGGYTLLLYLQYGEKY